MRFDEADYQRDYLLTQAHQRQLTGVKLKDESGADDAVTLTSGAENFFAGSIARPARRT